MNQLGHTQDVFFDEEKHEYRLNGAVVPSVTTILAELGIKAKPPEGIKTIDAGRQRGHAVHKIMEFYHNGEELQVAYNDWAKDNGIDVPFRIIEPYARAGIAHAIEHKLMDVQSEYRGVVLSDTDYPLYAFTIDVVNGEMADDYKTSATISEADYLQVAAYSAILADKEDILGHIVQLCKDETYKVFDVPQIWLEKWFGLLQIYYDPDMSLNNKMTNAKKLVKNQLDIPVELSKELIAAKEAEDKAKAKLAACKSKVKKFLKQKGIENNGVFNTEDTDLESFSFNKSKDGFSNSFDLKVFKQKARQTRAWSLIEQLIEDCETVKHKEGSYILRFESEKTKDNKSDKK